MLAARQDALYALMGDISEDCWCAGWMHGNEFALRRLVTDPSLNTDYGQGAVSQADVALMRRISAEIGGWIHWHDDESDPDLPSEAWGSRFSEADAWLLRYQRSK